MNAQLAMSSHGGNFDFHGSSSRIFSTEDMGSNISGNLFHVHVTFALLLKTPVPAKHLTLAYLPVTERERESEREKERERERERERTRESFITSARATLLLKH